MSFDHDPKAGPQVFSVRYSLSNLGSFQEQQHAKNMARQRVEAMLAHNLVEVTTTKNEQAYITNYEIRVFVLTPDQLARLVQEKAEKLNRGYPDVQFDNL